jgi:hypothetical protein
MDKVLDTHDLPKWSQEDINHLKISMTGNEIKAVIKSLLTKTSQRPDRFTAEFY